MILLMLSSTDLINIGLIKTHFLILTPTSLELEVYQFVCDRNLRCGQRGLPAPVRTHWIGLDWIYADTPHHSIGVTVSPMSVVSAYRPADMLTLGVLGVTWLTYTPTDNFFG